MKCIYIKLKMKNSILKKGILLQLLNFNSKYKLYKIYNLKENKTEWLENKDIKYITRKEIIVNNWHKQFLNNLLFKTF